MKWSGYSEAQVLGILRQVEGGVPVADLLVGLIQACRNLFLVCQ